MISRYSRPEMVSLWEPRSKFARWLEIEILAAEAWAQKGRVPKSAIAKIRQKARINPKRIDAIEKVVKHDVIAFLTNVAESVGPEARFLHLGLTSSDVLDTCFSWQLMDATDFLLKDLSQLFKSLKMQARRYKTTPMIGRSHGVHAEPLTFGLKVAGWYAEMKRHEARLKAARAEIAFGKLSGAVGTYANTEPFVEQYVCRRLKMKPETVATQVVPRDRYASYFAQLGVLASSVERIATEFRHLQRTEVLEVEEHFSKGQKGSSAMPHKRNPISAENLTGLARLVRSYTVPAMENVALWHERDISHSSVERVIAPDATILLDYMLVRLNNLVSGMIVYPKNMKANLDKMGGLVFSEAILLALVRTGLTREQAYKLVQQNAMKVWEEGKDFRTELKGDADIRKRLSPVQVDKLFDMKHHLRHVDTIFKRTFS